MNIYVISLAENNDRRPQISSQLNKLGFKWSFFDAIDLRNTDVIPCEYYDVNSSSKESTRLFTRGEVGCGMSHINLYKKLAEENEEYVTIMEDDAHIRAGFKEFLIDAENNDLWGYDILMLGYSKVDKNYERTFYQWEPISKKFKSGDITIGNVWREWTCGAVGYILNKNAIHSMSNQNKVNVLADDWKWLSKHFNLKIGHIRPLLILEDFHQYESSIEGERSALVKPRKEFLDSLRYVRGFIRKIILSLKSNV